MNRQKECEREGEIEREEEREREREREILEKCVRKREWKVERVRLQQTAR